MDDLDLGSTLKGFSPGTKVFNRYTLKKILGRGGMGVVWLARDEELEREVALKFLPEVVAMDKQSVGELKRETRRSLELTHPHIIRIYDFVQDGQSAAISMEYVAGQTLATRKAEQPGEFFSPEQLARWVSQLCTALDYAHGTAQVVHRDLKPANLMIDARGDLKIADFGIAASVSDSVSRVSARAGSSGTPVYMSPQQMMGDKPAVTDDIYSLGATLYDLLTSRPPFYSGNIIAQVQGKVAPGLNARRQELGVQAEPVSAAWEQTIAACLAKEAQERPQTAGEVLERLHLSSGFTTRGTKHTKEAESLKAENRAMGRANPQAMANEPDEPKAAASAVSRPKKSQAGLFAGIAAVVCVLAGAGYYFGIYAPEQKRQADEQKRLAEIKRLEDEGRAAEALRLKTEKEKADALAKEQADREQRDYAMIVAKIDAFIDGAPANFRTATDTAVKNYLATAPVRYRGEVESRWTTRQTAWEAARLAAARGGLRVRTIPDGAEVQVGSLALEKSPVTLREVRLGKYPVVVKAEGYDEWRGEVEVKENEFTDPEPIKLVRSTGRVVLTGLLGAEVFAGTKRLGTLPLTLDRVPTGSVRYTATAKGYKPAGVTGEVLRGQNLALALELEKNPIPQPGEAWENTLGQKFVPVPGTKILFPIWEARVKDYRAFVEATGHASTPGATFYSLRAKEWLTNLGVTWDSPGFPQTETHPVILVCPLDAEEFCRWLTEKERSEGRLGPKQFYRLPTGDEWVKANQTRSGSIPKYFWGEGFPPTSLVGNLAGSEARTDNWPNWITMDTYNDGYAQTAPVQSFAPSALGIYDLAGNAAEFTKDSDGKYQLYGAGWTVADEPRMVTTYKNELGATIGSVSVGFRAVLVTGER